MNLGLSNNNSRFLVFPMGAYTEPGQQGAVHGDEEDTGGLVLGNLLTIFIKYD
jgi:hypothetical protein